MRIQNRAVACALIGALGMGMISEQADAGLIGDGTFQLGNHPDATETPRDYGLIFDNLYTNIEGSRTFTFDFEHELSDVRMTVDTSAGTVRIFGDVFGGRELGTEWADDAHKGVYQLDMTYDIGVVQAPGDDDLHVILPSQNDGRLITPLGDAFLLTDRGDKNGEKFRLGDEDSNLGHRGFDGVSGWGRLRGNQLAERSEWPRGNLLFTVVPAPSTAVLGGLGMVCFVGRRRRDEA